MSKWYASQPKVWDPRWGALYRDVMVQQRRFLDDSIHGALTRTTTETRDVSDTKTLDGMSIEQLRELARRAEATAKAQEEKQRAEDAKYVLLGVGGDMGYTRRVRKSDGVVESKYPTSHGEWVALFPELASFIAARGRSVCDLQHAAEILTQLANKGGLK